MRGWADEYYVECNECGHVWRILTNGATPGLDQCSSCGSYNTTRHDEEPEETVEDEEIKSDVTVEDYFDDIR